MLRLRLALVATGLGFTLAGSSLADAQTTTMPPPEASFDIGNLHFVRYGQGDPALIFLPGLSMGAWTWASSINAFSKDHLVYAATLDGFDGTPPGQPPHLPQAESAILTLISEQQLKRPVIIGHSAGGHLALRMVEEHSDLFGGAVLVDATPFFPALQPGQTLAQRAQNIQIFADEVRDASDPLYESETRKTVATMVTDSSDAEVVTEHSLRSDRETVAAVMVEMSTDLRPGLDRITVPTLVVAPVSRDAPYMTDALRALSPQQLDDTIRSYYADQFAGAKVITVQTIDASKHFVMLDQPNALNAAISAFLTRLQQT